MNGIRAAIVNFLKNAGDKRLERAVETAIILAEVPVTKQDSQQFGMGVPMHDQAIKGIQRSIRLPSNEAHDIIPDVLVDIKELAICRSQFLDDEIPHRLFPVKNPVLADPARPDRDIIQSGHAIEETTIDCGVIRQEFFE